MKKNIMRSNMSQNTITGYAPQRKILFQAIEVNLSSTAGKTIFQNLTQLDGAIITNISVLPPKIAGYSAQTYSADIPTIGDYKAMFFTFQKDNIMVLENVPALVLNPFLDNDSNANTNYNSNPFWDLLFSSQPIDFNKSYVWMADTPSGTGIKVSLGISYFYP